MKIQKLLTFALFSLSSTIVSANIMPYGWHEEDDAIWQVQFEGQYDDQSNNLAEPSSVGTGYVLSGGDTQLSQLAPPLEADPDHDWGYVISLAYIAPSHKYDIRGNYTWLNSSKDISETHSINDVLLVTENISSADLDYKFRDADITLGRILKFGKHTLFRFGAGIGYADIKQTADNALTDTTIQPVGTGCMGAAITPCVFSTEGSFENKFRGMGPKFTFDGQYNFNWRLAIVGGLGISGLFGESEANLHAVTTYTDPSVIPQQLVAGNTNFKDDKVAIGIDGRVGLEFVPIQNDEVALDIEVGYQFTSYLNALQEGSALMQQDASGLGDGGNNGPSFANVLQEFNDNYFNSGLYVNIGLNYM